MIELSNKDIERFAGWSADRNPLHLDQQAAAGTAFGRTIAHGVLVAIEALRSERHFADTPLWTLDVEFRRAVYPGSVHAVQSSVDGDLVALQVQNVSKVDVLVARAGYAPADQKSAKLPMPSGLSGIVDGLTVRRRSEPADRTADQMGKDLELAGIYQAELPSDLVCGNALQLKILGLCSYLVGMEIPGLRSLFTGLQLTMHDVEASHDMLVYRVRVARFDPKFRILDTNLEVATADGRPIASGKLRSYVRFAPIVTDLGALAARLEREADKLAGQVALVCGGSRGLGADLVSALALAGCHVVTSYRHSASEATELVDRLAEHGASVELLPGDAGDISWCRSALEAITERYGRLDILVLNACAPPAPLAIGVENASRFEEYVSGNLPLVQSPLAALLPTLEVNRGVVVAISSSFVQETPPEFAHYVALKQAVEGLVRSAAVEFPHVSFVVPRPPRLQTSWNDTPAGALGAIPADHAATTIVKSIAEVAGAAEFRLLSEFPQFAVSDAADGEPEAAGLRLVVASSFTVDPLLVGLKFWFSELGVRVLPEVAPYGQLLQELLDPASALSDKGNGTSMVLLRVRDWLRELPKDQASSVDFLRTYLPELAGEFVRAVRTHRGHAAGDTLFMLCPSCLDRSSEVDRLLAQSEDYLLQELEHLPGLQVVEAQAFHELYSVDQGSIDDPLRDDIAHVPYLDGYFHVLATIAVRHLFRALTARKKVIVVDCDNTLWRGVVGEDGAAGIEFEPTHVALHNALRRLSMNGTLVCLCSKNEEADVWRVFETRDDCVLRRDDVVAAIINWQPKSENLETLASRLNLGLDSFLFIDDNPVECAEVRAACPEILTLQWPQDGQRASQLLTHTWEFDIVDQTVEDGRRTGLYRDEFQRQELRDETLTFGDFLESLNLVIEVSPVTEANLRRASQLTLRTNQFNFTTKRRNESELQTLVANDRYRCSTLQVRDRFGDYGCVGLFIAEVRDDRLDVDTFLLSCRVLGRGVEHRFAAELGRIAIERGIETVRFRFEATPRNAPARAFLDSISEPRHQRIKGDVLECELAASYLAELVYRPAEHAAGDDGDIQTAAEKSAAHTVDLRARMRERQIERTAFELATAGDLCRAIDGGEIASGRQPIAVGGIDAGEVSGHVIEAFAAALGLSSDTVEEMDQLEALGCSSFKIVEITVALTEQFPWLPSTLLFEHRSVSEIVKHIRELVSSDGGRPTPKAIGRTATGGESASAVDIAVVGMGVRCAGANSLDELWQLLSSGRRAVGPVPPERSPNDGQSHWAAMMDGVDQFDAEFFGLAPREVEVMDPQLRLLLEVAWGALEDAGIAGDAACHGTGIYIGAMYSDYVFLANSMAERKESPYRCWEAFSLANRMSQVFGFSGPSMAVNTACSSSGTALHLACEALKRGECRSAIVGGINLILDPDRLTQLDRLGILSHSGLCRPFGADADGTILGEGVGVVVLKPLNDARQHGDCIYGVIKGTALSTGSGTVGFTAPNPHAQAEAIRRCVSNARIDPRTISYVETHGTGTALGDPIEVRGLTLAYCDESLWDRNLRVKQHCRLATLKPNIGHLEAGAGVLGLIKVLLQLRHGMLAPSLTSDEPNPQIPFETLPFEIQRSLAPWERIEAEFDGVATQLPRRAGLSSFGVGGANAHVIVEEAPARSEVAPAEDHRRPTRQLLTISARNEQSRREQAGRFGEFLEQHPQVPLSDVCFTAAARRKHFEYRLALVAGDRKQLVDGLHEAADGGEPLGSVQAVVRGTDAEHKIAFLFTGQGAQCAGMGRDLYATSDVFREALDRCAAILDPLLDKPLLEVIFADPNDPAAELLNQTGFTQPALFAVEYALAELWRSWGLVPDVVMGHSVGELTAMCVAGGMSLEDGSKLIAARGRLMQALPAGGKMASVQASIAVVAGAIEGFEKYVSVAAINGPEQVVISGNGPQIDDIAAQLATGDIKVTFLSVSHAFHSPLMDPMIADYAAVAREIEFTAPATPLVSSVLGREASAELLDAEYWVNQIRSPVRFTDAMTALADGGATVYLEIGPQPVLLGMGRHCLPDDEGPWLPSLRRDTDAWQTLLGSVATLYVHGAAINCEGLAGPDARAQTSLPTYAFRHRRYWITAPQDGDVASASPLGATLSRLIEGDDAQGFTDYVRSAVAMTDEESVVLSKVFQALTQQARRESLEKTVPQLLYELVWRERPRSSIGSAPTAHGRWVVLADTGSVGMSLAKALAQRGAACTIVQAGNGFARLDDEQYSVDPDNSGDFDHLWQVLTEGDDPIEGIVSLWALDVTAAAEPGVVDLSRARVLGPQALMFLLQAIAKAALPTPPRLWAITRDAVVADPSRSPQTISPAMSMLAGFARVAALEHPEIWGGQIDLAADADDGGISERLVAEMLEPDGEDRITLCGDGRWVARLAHRQPAPTKEVELDGSGSYLVTGGVGALGLQLAQWLVSRGARHLVLCSRKEAKAPEVLSAVQAIEESGAEVRVIQVDVASERDVDRLFAELDAGTRPLRGVIHAAGIDQLVPIMSMTTEDLEAMLAAKVQGAWLVHQHTLDRQLDLFVCMSSIAAVVGSAGRAHYAAANSFLDALAQYRAGLGLPALSINWGPWKGGGMATDEQLQLLERMGNRGLEPDAALFALDNLIGSRAVQATVADIQWDRFRAVYESRGPRPLISEIDETSPSDQPVEQETGASWSGIIQGAPADERPRALAELMRTEVARTLGFGDPEDVRLDQGFFDMGLDSLTAVELAKRLQKRLGDTKISARDFSLPHLDALAAHLLGQVTEAPSHGLVNYRPELQKAVIEFQQAAYPERDASLIAPRWRWMFLESAQRLGVDPRVWLYQDANTIVGHKGAMPVKLKVGDEELLTAWLVETMVLESHRTKAVGTMLLMQAKQDMPLNLSLGQTELMRAMQLKMGWTCIGSLGTYLYPLRTRAVVRDKVPRGPIAWTAAGALAVARQVKHSLHSPTVTWHPEVRSISRFDETHDELWRRMSKELKCAVVRGASFLNWKYFDRPGQTFHCLEVRKGRDIVGVAIVSVREPDEFYQYRRAFLVDLLVCPSDREAVWATLGSVRAHCRQQDADAIIVHLANAALHDEIVGFGFLPRESTRVLLVLLDGVDQQHADLLSRMENWHLTMGDSDIDRPW